MPLLNLRREKFARGVAVGQSHRKAGLAAGFSRRSVSCLGAQLVRYHRVTERMSELRKSSQKAAQHSDRIKAQLNVPNEIESTPLLNADGVAIGIFVPLPTADQKAR